jgi:group II intron reverse transcriptase/maturase
MDLLGEIANRQTKFSCIKRKAQENPAEVFTSLAHHLTEEYLTTSFRKLRKSAASGIDEVNANDYELDFLQRIENLHARLKSGQYHAPNIRRVWIAKGNGKQRPLGISTTEDKIVQRAVTDILNLIYEQDFYEYSYGFRPRRSAHQALKELHCQCMKRRIRWVLDCDIQGCFDNFDHNILLSLLSKRIKDKRIMQQIKQWLKVGVVDGKSLQVSQRGTPQGNIISPLMCNVYMHYALDTWINETVRPLLKGEMFLIRYADDFIIGFEHEEDAKKVNRTLPKRMGKYGLTIHPEKSKLIKFSPDGKTRLPTFDFLGFTHYWGKSQKGKWMVKRKTRQKKMQAIIQNLKDTCKIHKHEKLKEQSKVLKSKLRGLYQYYGIRGNFISINRMYRIVLYAWFKWLNRRSQRKSYTWKGYWELINYFNLPKPKIIHYNV